MNEYANRMTARKLVAEIATCECKHCQGAIADRIFAELKAAELRGERRYGLGVSQHDRTCGDYPEGALA